MKRVITIAMCLIMTSICIVCGAVQADTTPQQQLDNLISNNELDEAMDTASEIVKLNPLEATFNDSINELTASYKQDIASRCNKLMAQGDYVSAHALLNDNIKYFASDEQMTNMLSVINSKLAKENLVAYDGKVEILSINPLMAYPETALNAKNVLNKKNDENHLTPYEFKKILQGLYNNNYVLVKLSDVYSGAKRKPLYLPPNKKPIILMLENMNYVTETRSTGFIDKVIIDRYGKLATYTSKKSINNRIKYDNESVTILEDFIEHYPEFSCSGARAVICANNRAGFLGYKTNKTNATSKFEIKRAMEVCNKLADLGYEFACGGFENSKSLSDLNFASELNTWNNYTSNITGSTFAYVCTITPDNEYKHSLLVDNGLTLLITHDEQDALHTTTIGGKQLREHTALTHLFDSANVYDHINRTVLYNTN